MKTRLSLALLLIATAGPLACRTTTEDSQALESAPGGSGGGASSASLPIVGTYRITGYEGSATDFAEADKLVVTDTLRPDGSVSRSGRYSFGLYKGSQLINTIGGDLSSAQPRCPRCYSFVALEGPTEWNGEQQNAMSVTFSWHGDVFTYGIASGSAEPEAPEVLPIVGCYRVKKFTGSFPGFKKANKVCVKNTQTADGVSRSGQYSFEVMRGNKLINTLGGSLSDAQPRCPGCYSFINISGTIDWDGEHPPKYLMSVNHMGSKFGFELNK